MRFVILTVSMFMLSGCFLQQHCTGSEMDWLRKGCAEWVTQPDRG